MSATIACPAALVVPTTINAVAHWIARVDFAAPATRLESSAAVTVIAATHWIASATRVAMHVGALVEAARATLNAAGRWIVKPEDV